MKVRALLSAALLLAMPLLAQQMNPANLDARASITGFATKPCNVAPASLFGICPDGIQSYIDVTLTPLAARPDSAVCPTNQISCRFVITDPNAKAIFASNFRVGETVYFYAVPGYCSEHSQNAGDFMLLTDGAFTASTGVCGSPY